MTQGSGGISSGEGRPKLLSETIMGELKGILGGKVEPGKVDEFGFSGELVNANQAKVLDSFKREGWVV
ncbi:MAG: hypothetical protein WC624_04955 [Candidatus Margulisiibacteriota bacterium]